MHEQKKRTRGAWVACALAMVLHGCGGGSSTPGPSAVGGTVSGLNANESVTLLNNGGDPVTVSEAGGFTFPTVLPGGAPYTVTVQTHTPGIACSLENGSGTAGSSSRTGVSVACAHGT